nr:MAG TPA_asm: hypothetical protein [Caudoviricetes sp.]
MTRNSQSVDASSMAWRPSTAGGSTKGLSLIRRGLG